MTDYLIERKFARVSKEFGFRPTNECPKWCFLFIKDGELVPVLMIKTKLGLDQPIRIRTIEEFECIESLINSMKKTGPTDEQNKRSSN